MYEISKTGNPELFSKHGHYQDEVYAVAGPESIEGCCGGAVKIQYNETQSRWLIPAESGYYTWEKLKQTLDSTSHADDWAALRDGHISTANSTELQTVQEHFANCGDSSLAAEVNQYLENLQQKS